VKIESFEKLIEEIFERGIDSAARELKKGQDMNEFKKMSKAQSRVEGVMTKYVTFLLRIVAKPTKAYIELKSYIAKQRSLSLYFEMISLVLSELIEDSISYS